MSGNPPPYRHTVRIRYGEVDRQGVAYNAHYMVYMDEAMESWLATLGDLRERFGWDMMLKRCAIEWQGSVGHNDLLEIAVGVTHWGRTSWTLGYVGTCASRPVFTGEVVYVSVPLGETRPMPTPDGVREALGAPVDASTLAGGGA